MYRVAEERESHCIHSTVFEWRVYCHPGLMLLVGGGWDPALDASIAYSENNLQLAL